MDTFFVVFVTCGAVLGIVSFFVGNHFLKKMDVDKRVKTAIVTSPIAFLFIVLSMYDIFIRNEINWVGIFISLIPLGFTIYVFVTNIIALKKSKEEK